MVFTWGRLERAEEQCKSRVEAQARPPTSRDDGMWSVGRTESLLERAAAGGVAW